jgi:hypothetical protein
MGRKFKNKLRTMKPDLSSNFGKMNSSKLKIYFDLSFPGACQPQANPDKSKI